MNNFNYSTIPTPGKVLLYLELEEIPSEQWASVLRLICLEGFIPQIRLTGTAHYTELIAVLYEGEEKPEVTEAFGKLNALIDIDAVLILARA